MKLINKTIILLIIIFGSSQYIQATHDDDYRDLPSYATWVSLGKMDNGWNSGSSSGNYYNSSTNYDSGSQNFFNGGSVDATVYHFLNSKSSKSTSSGGINSSVFSNNDASVSNSREGSNYTAEIYNGNASDIVNIGSKLADVLGLENSKITCPKCRKANLSSDGVCPSCGYKFDTNFGTGTLDEDIPIHDGIWILLAGTFLYLSFLLFLHRREARVRADN